MYIVHFVTFSHVILRISLLQLGEASSIVFAAMVLLFETEKKKKKTTSARKRVHCWSNLLKVRTEVCSRIKIVCANFFYFLCREG